MSTVLNTPNYGGPAFYRIPNHTKNDTYSGARYTLVNKTTENAIDVTGASVKIDFKETIDGSAVLTFSTTNGLITIADGENGIIDIEPSVITLDEGTYIYDMQITFTDGTVKTYLKGDWTILPDITE